jgi:hypothetical protein
MGRSISVSGKLTGDSTCHHKGARKLVYIRVWVEGSTKRGNDGVITGVTCIVIPVVMESLSVTPYL